MRTEELLKAAKSVCLFVFSKNKYVDFAVSPKGPKQNFDEKEFRERTETQTSALQKSFFSAGLCVFFSLLISAAVGFWTITKTGPCPTLISSLLQMAGVGITLWATLWELGDARSVNGNTGPEQLHQWVFKTMFCIGSALFFFAYSWSVQWY